MGFDVVKLAPIPRGALDAILELAAEAIIVADSDQRILRFSRGAEQMFGYAAAEAHGLPLRQILISDSHQHRQVCLSAFADSADSSVIQPCGSIRCCRKDGSEFSAEASFASLGGGPDRGYLAILREASGPRAVVAVESRGSRDALMNNEERFALAMRGANEGLWDWDLKAGRVSRSDRVLEIIGADSSASSPFRVTSQEWWVEQILPQDVDLYRDAVRSYLSRESSLFECEYRVVHASGEYRWVHDRAQAMWDEAGGALRMAGSLGDVTQSKESEAELRASEARLRGVASNIPGALFERVLTKDGKISTSFVSKQYQELTGYSPEESMADSQKVLKKILGAEQLSTLQAEIDASAVTMSTVDKTLHGTRKDGREIYIRSISRPRQLADGGTVWDGVLFDVTAERHLVERQKNLERLLHASQKAEALGNLAGGIAHDINNTLTPIVSLTELAMLDLPEDSKAHGNLSQVLRSTLRISDMVKQILEFSRRGQESRSMIDLRELVAESMQYLCHSLPSSIRLESHLGEAAVLVMADETQIHQILMNLLTNAEHATINGGAISVSLEHATVDNDDALQIPAGPYARLSVRDSGIGIPLAVIDRIFDPFFTTKPVGKGAGLGLSVVYGIVRAHGGAISVSSEVGHGTRFDVYLPSAAGGSGRR